MAKRVRYLVQIVSHLEERYGESKTQAIMGMASKIKALFKIPGLYRFVPKVFYGMTEKSFGPQAGFASKDKYLAKNEMRFNMVKRPYLDKCVHYGCPEIVRGFCDADDVCYGNLHPKLTWERTKTLGYGFDVCDFRVRIKES